MTTASNLPGKLFGIVIAALPMCSQKLQKGALWQRLDAIGIAIIITLVSAMQIAIGFFINLVFSAVGSPLYSGYGTEMFMGFCGGHAIASMVGNMFQSLGQDYWETAQGVGMTFATIGMVFGILLGVLILNRATHKGNTHYIKQLSELPLDMQVGLYQSVDAQPFAGRQTTSGGSIDTLGLHLGFIMMDVGIGYLIYNFICWLQIPYLKDMDAWLFILLSMYLLWFIVRKLGWDIHFDAQIKSKIQGCVTDFIVTAAIMSMPISLILELWLPLLLTAFLGFLATVPVIIILCRRYMAEDPIEKAMGPIGMMTGDFITGVLLTRMADPELKSNALGDFSIAYAINTIYCVTMLAVLFPLVVNFGAQNAFLFSMAQIVVLFVILLLFGRFSRKAHRN